VFFHRSAVEGEFDALAEGQQVSYDLQIAGARPRAARVWSDVRSAPRRGRTAGTRTSALPAGKRPIPRTRPSYSAAKSQPARERRERREQVQRPAACKRGFVTKLRYHEPHGFISADSGGTEIRFEPSSVAGEKQFGVLKVGDYVEFAVRPETADTKAPEASYVREIERTHHFPQTQLSRHPKSRRKKPTWR
jgi:cold shock CspA family protein